MNSPKYNRTYHVPWSPGCTSDDKIATSIENLIGQPIVITEKIDGSNTSLEQMGCFARTHSGPPTHPSFNELKALHAQIGFEIPPNMQLFGEWCFAKHSIAYDALPGYFLLFGIRDLDSDPPFWYDWDEVETWGEYFGLPTVPVLFKDSVSSEKGLKDLVESLMIQPSACGGIREGIVVRVARAFSDEDFSKCILKCVRKDHVTTNVHWAHQTIVPNKLKSK
jgi:hypothetical protein